VVNLIFVSAAALTGWAVAASLAVWLWSDKVELSAARNARLLDPLTGLYNSEGWRYRSSEHIATHGHRRGVFVVLDADNFKQINDTLGHRIGDRLLFEIGRRIAAFLGPDDIAARTGGDEYAILLSWPNDIATLSRLSDVLDELWRSLSQPTFIDGMRLAVTVSVGAAPIVEPFSVEEALDAADRAMYECKRGSAPVIAGLKCDIGSLPSLSAPT
jgi:diguanylate cyclase